VGQALLINSPPQVVTLAIDLYEDLVDEESIAIALMATLQTPGVFRPKLDAPEADGFVTDCDAAFSEQIFNISVTQVEAIVNPDSLTDDVGWESVVFVRIHPEIIHFRELSCQYRSKYKSGYRLRIFYPACAKYLG